MAFAENLAVFFADMGVDCVTTGTNVHFRGLLDTPDDLLDQAGVPVVSTEYALTCVTADIAPAGLVYSAGVVINGVTYTVREVLLLDDGALTRIQLMRHSLA